MAGPDQDRSSAAPPRAAPQPYWERVGRVHAAGDPLGAVCYPGAPAWFNHFIAGLQWRAVTARLERLPVAGKTALDVGCGPGRWSRWLADHGADTVGIDAAAAMIEAARRAAPGADFRQMSVTALDFLDASFDLVVAVTVVQHLRPEDQLAAIGEICRVTRRGGYVLVLDLIDPLDAGPTVHPRPPQSWIDGYARSGAQLVTWRGQEYVPALRAARWIGERLARAAGDPGATGPGGTGSLSIWERAGRGGIFRLAYGALWAVVQLSRLLEPLCERVLPDRWARHGCFVFRKTAAPDGSLPPPLP